MKLMTKEIEKKLRELDKEIDKNMKAQVHYFNPTGRGDWFGFTYDPERKLFFGYVSIFGDWNDELGYFSLEELEALQLPLGLSIERDLHYQPQTLEEIKNAYTKLQ